MYFAEIHKTKYTPTSSNLLSHFTITENGIQEGEENQPQSEEEEEEEVEGTCQDCFLLPCCTTYNHDFVGLGQAASNANPAMRRKRYKKYWNVLTNLGGWRKHRYVAKKRQMTRQNADVTVWHQREIMPNCVLHQLRGLYPNPDNIPYMGHKWQ